MVEKKACSNSRMLQNYIVASPRFPSTQTVVLCTALCCHCTTSCTQQVTLYHHPGEGQREQVAIGCPIAEYGQHVLPPNPCPIYPRRISCKVAQRIHELWKRLLHPKLMEDTLVMMPLHYPKIYQWHLSPPNMLADNAIRK